LNTRNVDTVVGSPAGFGYRDGSIDEAILNAPRSVAVGETDQVLFIADRGNGVIRRAAWQYSLQCDQLWLQYQSKVIDMVWQWGSRFEGTGNVGPPLLNVDRLECMKACDSRPECSGATHLEVNGVVQCKLFSGKSMLIEGSTNDTAYAKGFGVMTTPEQVISLYKNENDRASQAIWKLRAAIMSETHEAFTIRKMSICAKEDVEPSRLVANNERCCFVKEAEGPGADGVIFNFS